MFKEGIRSANCGRRVNFPHKAKKNTYKLQQAFQLFTSSFKLIPLEMPHRSSKQTSLKAVPRHIPAYDEVLQQNFASTLRLPTYRFSHAKRYHPYRRHPRFIFETESADLPIPPTPVILPQAYGVVPLHYDLDDDDYIGEDELDEEFELVGEEEQLGQQGQGQDQGDRLANEKPVAILTRIVRQYQNVLIMFLLWILSVV
ncbi:uncharacterized protein EV420DRAFT_289648 [Desarmillaria tabescens]|uniref:Uncharacterized protein n=1 Tax=Armillaria tabescens TaxID=1929756 RepID=A0AA39N712_ARMTA|nr:uncharacterized protein EV420DRAFT_289648 [Desarmillaria tabescens]KAK0459783.1 hypothetical protein EV420DRAFT_289648 [Desarmillaria tabescens]